MWPPLLNQIERAEQFERDLETRAAAARARWLKFWKWLALVILCLGLLVIGLLVGRALP
jgi:hypothetical protein